MTILFCDGFENYNNIADMAGMWSAGQTGTPTFQLAGRDAAAGKSIRLNVELDSMSKAFDEINEVIVGFAFKKDNATTVRDFFLEFRHPSASSGQHLRFYITTGNKLEFTRSASPSLAVSSRSIPDNVWIYIEARVLIHDTLGELEVLVNGKSGGWINETGLDTTNNGSELVDEILFTGARNMSGRPFNFDDLYILDPNLGGAPGNTFLGDSIVETLNPSGVGAEAQWTASPAVANHLNVDEPVPDGDTTFNSSQVVDDDDRFAMDDLVNIPSTIFGVQVQAASRLENSGARTLRWKAHDGVAEGVSTDIIPTFDTVYLMEPFMFEDHPAGAAPWSTAEVNAMEAGYRIQA